MRRDIDESEPVRSVGASLVTSWVVAALLIIVTTFVAQFPGREPARPALVAAR